jgi:GAF domain-containing protein
LDPSLLPPDETARLAALARYRLLDARSERVLDEVVAIAARLFRVTNAMLSIVEENTVLLKAPYQLPVDIERIPRHQSLCSATILQPGGVVYDDLSKNSDPRIDISLVQQLGMSFYAGHTLHTADGYHLGAICLFDDGPRSFSPAERLLLAHFGGVVMALLELRLALGADADTSFQLWEPIYGVIGSLLRRLEAVADQADHTTHRRPYTLPDQLAREASGVAHMVELHIRAAEARVAA